MAGWVDWTGSVCPAGWNFATGRLATGTNLQAAPARLNSKRYSNAPEFRCGRDVCGRCLRMADRLSGLDSLVPPRSLRQNPAADWFWPYGKVRRRTKVESETRTVTSKGYKPVRRLR